MGRLFWKLFLAFLSAQVLAGLAVGLVISLLYPRPQSPAGGQEARLIGMLEREARWVRQLDTTQLRRALASDAPVPAPAPALVPGLGGPDGPAPMLLAIDTQGQELLGRPYLTDWLHTAHSVTMADGTVLRLFFAPLPGRTGPPGGPPAVPPFPLVHLLIGLLTALAFSALLAWYLTRPLRHLRQGFEALGAGHLETRVAAQMGHRQDEIGELGQRFDTMAERVQQLLQAQRRLLHDVSHELRSPLARLAAAVGLLRQNPARYEASLVRIERETTRLDQLVGELLTLSRLEAGTNGAEAGLIDLSDLLADAVEDARFEGQTRACSVRLNGREGLRLNGQAELLYRAFDNILRNALRHSPQGGTINVTVSADQGWGRILIEDEGQGLPETVLAHVFEPFQRGGTAEDGSGFGLGLAIARRAVEAHGGRIVARNRATGGLCVEIALPLA